MLISPFMSAVPKWTEIRFQGNSGVNWLVLGLSRPVHRTDSLFVHGRRWGPLSSVRLPWLAPLSPMIANEANDGWEVPPTCRAQIGTTGGREAGIPSFYVQHVFSALQRVLASLLQGLRLRFCFAMRSENEQESPRRWATSGQIVHWKFCTSSKDRSPEKKKKKAQVTVDKPVSVFKFYLFKTDRSIFQTSSWRSVQYKSKRQFIKSEVCMSELQFWYTTTLTFEPVYIPWALNTETCIESLVTTRRVIYSVDPHGNLLYPHIT